VIEIRNGQFSATISSNEDEDILKVRVEKAALIGKRIEALATFGEMALPELADKPEFAGQVEKVESFTAEISALEEKEAALQAEKELREAALRAEMERKEREERERIARLTCYKCKTVNPDDARFCEKCGSKLGDPPREYCKNCGLMNQPGMKFCGECGNKLE